MSLIRTYCIGFLIFYIFFFLSRLYIAGLYHKDQTHSNRIQIRNLNKWQSLLISNYSWSSFRPDGWCVCVYYTCAIFKYVLALGARTRKTEN